MSYNTLTKPRFYTNSIEYLYNTGFIEEVDPIFLSYSWHNPILHSLNSSVTFGNKKEFIVKFNKQGLLKNINYIMILGHTMNSTASSFRIKLYSNGIDTDSVVDQEGRLSSNTSITGETPITWNAPTYDYVPIIITFDSGYLATIDEIRFIVFNKDGGNDPIALSGMSIGNYYDLPYNPDLGIKKTISYDGVNTYDTIGGKTLSSNYSSSKKFNPFVNVYSDSETQTTYDDDIYIDLISSQDYIPSGRRSYDISYSYIGQASDGQNYLMPRDFNYYKDFNNQAYDNTYDSKKNNLYTSVITKTIGTHIPFIFSLNGSNSNELLLARFTNNKFSFDEVAPSVHNVSFGIREVW
tara:strand:+ start:1974 stop:3029 length:1056 start_codon:yes stop_codon:yes gene_type:complete